jgi:hypothetical protein
MHSTITVSYDFCWLSFSFVLLFIIINIIIVILMSWDARVFCAGFYFLDYVAGDDVTVNLFEFECL